MELNGSSAPLPRNRGQTRGRVCLVQSIHGIRSDYLVEGTHGCPAHKTLLMDMQNKTENLWEIENKRAGVKFHSLVETCIFIIDLLPIEMTKFLHKDLKRHGTNTDRE